MELLFDQIIKRNKQMQPSSHAVNNKDMSRACEHTEGNINIVYPVFTGRVPREKKYKC